MFTLDTHDEVICRTVKTKIMCTIGPKSRSKETIIDMINNGMTLARINMVHSTTEVRNAY